MSNPASRKGMVPEGNVSERVVRYKKDFWEEENLKFGEPWYRLEKAAGIISGLAGRSECTLLDIGCGPGRLDAAAPGDHKLFRY